MIPTGHHGNNPSSSDVHILNQSGIRLLLVALAMMAGIGPAPGQAPGIIDSSDRDAELYHRANRYYSYA